MSLIHWWPLNGDYIDRVTGVAGTDNSNDTMDGKLGGTAINCTGNSWLETNQQVILGTGDFSIAAWVYLVQTSGKTYQAIISNKPASGSSNGFSIYWNQTQKKFLWSTADGTAGEYWMANTIDNFMYNTWNHVVMVRNNSDDKKGYFYINGTRYELASTPAIRNITQTATVKIGKNNTNSATYYWTGGIQDVRIYDHALSIAEVKELSKGLMIHYTFNDSWNDGTTNLLPVDKQTQSNTAAAINVTEGLVSGATYTLSSYVTRSSSCTATNPRMTIIFNYSDGTSKPHSKYNDGGASYPKDGVERFYYITATANAAKTLTSISGWILDHSSGTGKKMTARNSQLEISDHPTIYTPTTRENIVFDDSGNGYDAIGYNVGLQPTTNVGSYAAKFNGSTSYYEVPVPRADIFCTPYTLSFWVNPDDDGRAIYFGDHSTSGGVSMNFERKSGGAFRYYHGGNPDKEVSGLTSPVGEWTMITVTSNGTTMRFYKNGSEVSNSAYTFTPTITKPSGHMRIGRDNRSDSTALAGYISDFRWYATALSADDVKILYESKAAVDKLSNFYTNEFIELDTANVDVTKKFTIKTNEIIESQENGFYKDGHMTSNTIYEI